jgi:hypothetical protein
METAEWTPQMAAEREVRGKLRALSRALQEVHRTLIQTARDRYERASGPVRSRGQLLDLLLHDGSFGWLRPLSGLIVEIEELAARDPAPTAEETAAMGSLVRSLTSSSDDPDAFGSYYVGLLASEPNVAISHLSLRDALGGLPEPRAG